MSNPFPREDDQMARFDAGVYRSESHASTSTPYTPQHGAPRHASMNAFEQESFDPRYVSHNVQAVPEGRAQWGRASEMLDARDRRKKGRLVWRIIFWIALVVFFVSAGVLGYFVWTYWHADQGYKDIASQAVVTDVSDEQASSTDALAAMTIDWDYLRSLNADVVAWVTVPDTRINYPVVQTSDNETYLYTDFAQNSDFAARSGAIFQEASNTPGFGDTNNVLYGHHMRDGSMFAVLSTDFVKSDFFNAHRTVYVLTPEMNYECSAFSLVLTDGYDPIVQTNFTTDEERSAYILDKEQRSVVAPSENFPDPTSIEKIFTLSTCDYQESDGRAVLFANVVDSAAPNNA